MIIIILGILAIKIIQDGGQDLKLEKDLFRKAGLILENIQFSKSLK